MRLTLLMMVAAFSLWAGATETPDVFERYFDQVMVGQKWQFEVTDLDTDVISIADVKITGYAGDYPWMDELRYSVEVSFGESVVENYVLWDNGQLLLAFSDKKNSYVAMADYDNIEGKPSESNWGKHVFTVTEVDYVFAAHRARKRMRLVDTDKDYRSVYVTGVGLDKFEIHSDDWDHNRSFRLLKTEYPDGTTMTPDVYDSPRLVPDNKYYEEGMVMVYDCLRVPNYNKLYEDEYRVAGDTVAFHVPCKKMEIWKENCKLGEFAIFDIDGQVYQAGNRNGYKSFSPYALYNLEVGDRIIAWDESTEVTDVFNISVEGIDRKVIKFAQAKDYGIGAIYGYWVEGVGPNQENGFWKPAPFSLSTCLNSMYRNGNKVFNYASLFQTDGVESIESDENGRTGSHSDSDDTPIYNLQGIRIYRTVPGQPYIRDGRIIINRK